MENFEIREGEVWMGKFETEKFGGQICEGEI